jgi:hypothetical protein
LALQSGNVLEVSAASYLVITPEDVKRLHRQLVHPEPSQLSALRSAAVHSADETANLDQVVRMQSVLSVIDEEGVELSFNLLQQCCASKVGGGVFMPVTDTRTHGSFWGLDKFYKFPMSGVVDGKLTAVC